MHPSCLQGGDLMHNIAAGRVSWYRRGRKVSKGGGQLGPALAHASVCK